MPAWAAFGEKSSTSVTGRGACDPPLPPQPGIASASSAARGRRARRMAEQGMRTCRGSATRAMREGGTLEASEAKEPGEERTLGDELAEDAAASTVAEVIPARGPAAYV